MEKVERKKAPQLYKEYQLTGNIELDLDVVEKYWDHRFVLFQTAVFNRKTYAIEPNKYEYRFIKYLRRGSSCTELKFSISSEQAKELIDRLKLVESKSIGTASTWRKEGFSELNMMKIKKVKT